ARDAAGRSRSRHRFPARPGRSDRRGQPRRAPDPRQARWCDRCVRGRRGAGPGPPRGARPAAHGDRADRCQPRGSAARARARPRGGPRAHRDRRRPCGPAHAGAHRTRVEGRGGLSAPYPCRMHTSAPHAPSDLASPRPAEGITIAIDGPAGSGKSTVSRMVAEALDGGILDTGAMYRSVTWWCLDQGIDLTDREAVARAAEEIDLVQGTDPSGATVVVAGTDITAEIRTQPISQQVSAVATNTLVRAILQRRQRELFFAAAAERGFCVAEGRDITTVVAPDAHVRVLLTASDEERMRRRAAELDLEDNEDTRAR